MPLIFEMVALANIPDQGRHEAGYTCRSGLSDARVNNSIGTLVQQPIG